MVTMIGSKAIVESLRHEGTEYIFGLPGSTEILLLDALEDCQDIRYILCLHEVVALGMAEGYARASGKVGVVNLHTCAGLAAALPMLYNAQIGGVPLVVTAGQQDTRLFIQEPTLSGDLTGIASYFTKWSTEIIHAADIPMTIRRAFKVATQLPTGPVFVSLPQDVMMESFDYEPAAIAPYFIKMRPDQEAITTAAELLGKARSPAIIVRDGVARNDALSELVEFAELIGAPVYQAWMADVNFPTGHPQYFGNLVPRGLPTSEKLRSIDILVVVGAPLFSLGLYPPEIIITPNTKIIQIDDNPRQIAKNYPVASGILGHIKLSLADLNIALSSRMTMQAREAAKIRKVDLAKEKEHRIRDLSEKAQLERDHIPISISRLLQELRDTLKPGTLVVEESPSYAATMQNSLEFNEPLNYIRCRGAGSIGWGMPAAIGVKLAMPDRPIVAVLGDGTAIWSFQSLWTATHYHLPVTYIICANASYNSLKSAKIRRMGEKVRGRYLGMDFHQPRIDFCELAHAMGVQGQKVERPEELREALKSALESSESSLVEVYL